MSNLSYESIEQYQSNVAAYTKLNNQLTSLHQEKQSNIDLIKTKEEQIFNRTFKITYVCLSILAIGFLYKSTTNLILSIFLGLLAALYPGVIIIVILESFLEKLFNSEQLKVIEEIKNSNIQLEHKIELVKVDIDTKRKELNAFEEQSKKPYEKLIESYYQEKLFRKKSGTPEFEQSIAEFAEIIRMLAEINAGLITTRIKLWDYEEYLKKRIYNHQIQSSKFSSEFELVKEFHRKLSKPNQESKIQAKDNILPPEKKYNVTRKIETNVIRKINNWEEINKKRLLTGREGEVIAFLIEKDYLESINRKDLADKVRHVSKELGDGLGYDILSYLYNGSEKFIEVKSTTNSLDSPYNLSRNELDFLKNHSQDYWVYRVFITDEDPQIKVISSKEVLESNIVPIQFLVSQKQ